MLPIFVWDYDKRRNLIMQLRKKKDKIQQDAEFVQEDQVVLVETANQEDQEWVANQVVSVLKKRANKNTKKTAKKMMTKADKIKALGAGALGVAGTWVAYNFAMRKFIEYGMDAQLQDKDAIQRLVFDEIVNQYPEYVNPEYQVNEYVIQNVANQLYADGRQDEAQAILELLNGLNSGVFNAGDVNEFLVNNNLSTVVPNLLPNSTDVEQAMYQAYADVYGFNPKGMNEREVIAAIIQNHMAPLCEPGTPATDMYWDFEDLPVEQRIALNKVHEDYVILLNKTSNQYLTDSKQITEADLDTLLATRWSDVDVPLDATMFDKLYLVVRNYEWDMAGYAGLSDMQLMLALQNYMDQGGTYDYNTYKEYLKYRVLYENMNQKLGLKSDQDIFAIWGYEGDLLGEYKHVGSDDYIFARVMEDKYSGLQCVKDNGEIDFTNTAGLSPQQLSDYQVDLNNYNTWKSGSTTQDVLQGVQDLGFLSEDILNQYSTETTNHINASPIFNGIAGVSMVVGGLAVMTGYRKWKIHQNKKFISIWDEEMAKRGLTEADFIKHHYSFEEVDESLEMQNTASK